MWCFHFLDNMCERMFAIPALPVFMFTKKPHPCLRSSSVHRQRSGHTTHNRTHQHSVNTSFEFKRVDEHDASFTHTHLRVPYCNRRCVTVGVQGVKREAFDRGWDNMQRLLLHSFPMSSLSLGRRQQLHWDKPESSTACLISPAARNSLSDLCEVMCVKLVDDGDERNCSIERQRSPTFLY